MSYTGDEAELPKDSLGIALVPGNPGIPHFYCPFGEQLHKALLAEGVGPVAIYTVGYPNFSTTAAAKTEAQGVAPIDDEASIISEVLDELAAQHGRGLVLLGHSIGAWMVLQHLLRKNRHGDDHGQKHLRSVPMAFLAMPFLEVFDNWKQRLLFCLVAFPLFSGLARVAALTLLALPLWARPWVLRLMVGPAAGSAREEVATATFLDQPHHGMGVLLMLKSELERLNPAITRDAGFGELKALLQAPNRPPVVGLYTHGDSWAPEAHFDRFRALLGEGDEVMDLGSGDFVARCGGKPPPHDFVMEDAYLGPMAELVAKHVTSHLRDGSGGGNRKEA